MSGELTLGSRPLVRSEVQSLATVGPDGTLELAVRSLCNGGRTSCWRQRGEPTSDSSFGLELYGPHDGIVITADGHLGGLHSTMTTDDCVPRTVPTDPCYQH